MTPPDGNESRLDRIERILAATAVEFDRRMEVLSVNIESLHSSIGELVDASREHSKQMERDGEHLNALVRIAEIHEHRLSDLEGGE